MQILKRLFPGLLALTAAGGALAHEQPALDALGVAHVHGRDLAAVMALAAIVIIAALALRRRTKSSKSSRTR